MHSAKSLLILGAGKYAAELTDLAADVPEYRVTGYLQTEGPDHAKTEWLGRPVYWLETAAKLSEDHWIVSGIGTMARLAVIEQAESLGFRAATIAHPTSHVSETSELCDGAVIGVRAVVASYSRIGRHVLLNRGSLIGHHTEIGDGVIVGPGANIAGSCTIGERVLIGMGAIVLNDVTIGSDSMIASGALVSRSVPPGSRVLPGRARVVKGAGND